MTEATALARVTGPPSPSEWNAMVQQANTIARTEFVPAGLRGKPEAVLACILTGRELGIGPMQALQSIAVIDGKPNLSAELQRALVQRAGHQISVNPKSDHRAAAVSGKRSDTGQTDAVTWTIEDAVQAGLCKLDGEGKVVARSQNGHPLPWEKYTRQLLVARATSELTGRLFADVLAGIGYTADELTNGEVVAAEDVGEEPPVDGEVVPGAPATDDGRDPRLTALWTAFRDRFDTKATAVLRNEIAPKTGTRDLTGEEITALLNKVNDPNWEPVLAPLPARLQAEADAPWEASEQDVKISGDAVEERRMALGLAAEMAAEFGWDDAQLAEVVGFKTPLPELALSSLRQAVDKLELYGTENPQRGQ